MAGRASAFAVLGLEPGADSTAVEQAYKRLIKLHHPDREGGDGTRAAEINRAYRELRGGRAMSDPLEFNEEFELERRASRWPAALFIATLVILAIAMVLGPSVPRPDRFSSVERLVKGGGSAAVATAAPLEGSVHTDAINDAIRDAVELYRTKDEVALTAASRDCQRRFRENPGTRLLDRCAAFDDAVVGLQDRDPLRDEGPFSPLAVTGRQWSAASVLSDDYLAIDSRLARIRLQVELAMAPEVAPEPPQR